MSSNEDFSVHPSQPSDSSQQLTVITQLMQSVTTMHHIDELFFWLAQMIAHHLDVSVVEFWARQANSVGDFSLDLRASVCQSDAIPRQLAAGDAVRLFVEGIQRERRGFWLKPVHDVFSTYQANLFTRYGLSYCSCYVLKSNALLAPPHDEDATGKVATPLMLAVLLFLGHTPSQRRLLGIGHILERSLVIAKNRSLLSSPDGSGAIPAVPPMSPPPHHSLSHLIPRRIQDPDLMKSSNPLAGVVDIHGKEVRHLYSAIDGRRNITELALVTQLSMNEVYLALQILCEGCHVQLYEPDWKAVDSAVYLNNR